MGSYYDHEKMAWVSRQIQIPQDEKCLCLCWLSECYCQFQHHTDHFVVCDDPEIFKLCLDKEDINYGEAV